MAKTVTQTYSRTHTFEIFRELPDTAFDPTALRAVRLEYRREDGGLQPTVVELRVGVVVFYLHMSAYVVAPVAVADIRRRRRKLRNELQHRPLVRRVARKANLVTVAAQSAPTVVDDGTLRIYALRHTLPRHIIKESVIQPESVAQIVRVLAGLPLLPVEPPEIDALTLERMYHRIEIGVRPLHLVDAERHRSLLARLAAILLRAGELPAALAIDIALGTVVILGAGEIILHETLVAILVRLDA